MGYPVCYSLAMEICMRPAARLVQATFGQDWVWDEIVIPSNTEEGKTYTVSYSPHGRYQSLCDCEGFEHRGHCSHIDRASEIVNCEWTDNDEQVRQTEESICPECGSISFPIPTRK